MVSINNLKGSRIARGLTQQDMANLLNIERSTYGKKESGEYDFWESEINIILETLDEKYENIFLNRKLTKRENV